jgi:hypothetical protein
MHFFKGYVEYLKRNPEGYWFRRKLYGWGWVPARLPGWLTLLVFLIVFVWLLEPFVRSQSLSTMDIVWFLVRVGMWVGALQLVCYAMGEPPKWQWGMQEKNSQESNTTQ